MITEDEWKAIGKFIGEQLKAFPKNKLNNEVIIEVLGEEFGRHRCEIDMRFEALEERAVDENRLRQVRLSMAEWQADQERELGRVDGEIASLKAQLNAMQAENDILRQCLSPKDTMRAADAISMLRSVR